MPEEQDAWLETLGVRFESSDEDSSAADVAGVTSDNASDSAPDAAADVADDATGVAGQIARADIVGAPGGSTLVVDDPIGVLPLISASPAGSAGRAFNVVVASTAKDGLLVAASVSGTLIGTVKISQPGGVTTLQNVQITALSASGAGSNITMTLESIPPRKSGPATLIMDDPIGELPLISASPASSGGREFNVVVASSAKDPLIFAASTFGKSVGTVKISLPGVVFTLRNVLITSLNISGAGAPIAMTLNSSSPAEVSAE